MKYIKPVWQAPAHIHAYTTVRESFGAPSTDETEQNRQRDQLKTLLELPADPVWLSQKHTNIAVEAVLANKEKIADASFTTNKNQICAVLTADCLPLLICHQKGTHVAAIHAGWRGLAGGIIESTLSALNQPGDELLVWLGPAIGPEKFEVGEDVFTAFIDKVPESETAFKAHKQGKWFANLYDLAKIRLKRQGVMHITGGNFCTYTQQDLFYSYRREKDKRGEMASVIWIG